MPRVFVDVYGCSANQADAEIASGLLEETGHILVDSENEADITVLLTCVVKTPTEQKILKRIKALVTRNTPLIVAGCMPKTLRDNLEKVAPQASMVGPDDVSMIPIAVREALEGRRNIYLSGAMRDRTCLPRKRMNDIIHIAPIASGCLGNCSYCIVKLARGKLNSFPAEGIISDIKSALEEGCREIWLTAEDTAAYDYEGILLPDLLRMISSIDGRFMIRVGMMTPNVALPIIDELIEAYQSEKMFKFLHIPIQSGNDEVLAHMRRKYNVSEFKEVVSRFRAAIPEISISTDIICGFPGETEKQFAESLDLIKWLKPDALNTSRFWPRPGTEAATLTGQLSGGKTKERSRRLNDLWKNMAVESSTRWVGWKGELLLDEEGHSETKVGRNYTYKAVALQTQHNLGDFINIQVEKAGKGFLIGKEI